MLPGHEGWQQDAKNWQHDRQMVLGQVEPGHTLQDMGEVGGQEERDASPWQVVHVGDGAGSAGQDRGQHSRQFA